jgi:hypothetical protein
MVKKGLVLCVWLATFSLSASATGSVEEDKAWNRCLKIKSEKDKKNCMIKFEKKFYPESVYSDEELNWSDIDWSRTS